MTLLFQKAGTSWSHKFVFLKKNILWANNVEQAFDSNIEDWRSKYYVSLSYWHNSPAYSLVDIFNVINIKYIFFNLDCYIFMFYVISVNVIFNWKWTINQNIHKDSEWSCTNHILFRVEINITPSSEISYWNHSAAVLENCLSGGPGR